MFKTDDKKARRAQKSGVGPKHIDPEEFGKVAIVMGHQEDDDYSPPPTPRTTPTSTVSEVETNLDIPMSEKAVRAALSRIEKCMQQPGMDTRSIQGKHGKYSPAETMIMLLGANAAPTEVTSRYETKLDMARAIVDVGKSQGFDTAFFQVINPIDTSKLPSLVTFINQGSKHVCQKTHGIEAKNSVTAVLADVVRDASHQMEASIEAETMLRATGVAKGISREVK